jgi:uncharacterized protein (TIGR00369 family)
MALQIPPNCDLTLGLTCVDKSTPGTSTWTMRVDERFLNPAGVVQGGFLAAMADSAMGACAVTAARQGKMTVANTVMKVSMVRPARLGAQLTCTATVLKAGRAITFVQANIVDDQERLIATASSTYLTRERTE